MGNKNGICLVVAMDHLWFHKIIFSSQPISSLLYQESLKTPTYQLSNNSIPQDDQVLSEISTAVTLLQMDEFKNENQIIQKKRATRLKIQASKSFSHSSSSSKSTKNRSKNLKYSGSITGLNKTMSCKSLKELEIEEVKGFIDLGFKFSAENINPIVIKVLPGLERLKKEEETETKDQETGEEVESEKIKRPYLSEAWIVKRSELPFIKLSVPIGVSEEYELKKHIKDWARTVACSVFYQES